MSAAWMQQTSPDLRILINKWSWAFIANRHVTGATENRSHAAGRRECGAREGDGLFMACWWRDNFPYEEQLSRGTGKINQDEVQRKGEKHKGIWIKMTAHKTIQIENAVTFKNNLGPKEKKNNQVFSGSETIFQEVRDIKWNECALPKTHLALKPS